MASAALGDALRQIHRLFDEGTVAGLADAQLLERFLDHRDETAFAALVERHGPMVLGTCRAVLKDPHDAEDAFQAAFLILVRKARSIRGRDSLGGWLHRVAHRVAVEANARAARRRIKEHQAGAKVAAHVSASREWDDLRQALHAEVDRLPEKYRLPVVLCDLQGLSRDEAAGRLCWTEGMIRGRLARARSLLRSRLTRRGLAPSLALPLFGAVARGAMPAAWVAATVRAASRFATEDPSSASATATALVTAALNAMSLAKLKAVVTLALTVAALALVGTAAFYAQDNERNVQTDEGRVHLQQPPAPSPRPAAAPLPDKKSDPAGSITFRGRVVGPDGQPVPGAKLFMVTSFDKEASSPSRAIAGPDGRFAFSVGLSEFRDPNFARQARVTAAAQGFGIGMSDWIKDWKAGSEAPDAGHDLTIRLVEDLPVEGRVLDMEGHPVAGASVRAETVWASPEESLDPWLAAAQARESNRYATQYKYVSIRFPLADRTAGAIPATSTDAQGRFRLTGIGRERLAELRIEKPTMRLIEIEVLTRRCDPIQVSNHPRLAMAGSTTYYGASPRLVASPSRPIEGVVRDKQTGKPIAGAKISSYSFADTKVGNHTVLKTTSDAQGRYRIHGMPRGSGNQLMALAPTQEPYFPTIDTLGDPPGLGTVHHDIELVRGTLVEGRITNLKTGAPVRASIRYHIASDNPHLEDSPSLRQLPASGVYSFAASAGDDGKFQITALPGRGLLSIEARDNDFPDIDPHAEDLRGKFVPEPNGFYQAAIKIDVPAGITRFRHDIPLEPGLTLEGNLVDPDGKPLKGAIAYGLDYLGGWTSQPLKEATLHVKALKIVDEQGHPGQIRSDEDGKTTWFPRTLVFLHQERKLAGWIDVRGNETGPLRIRMEPSATTVGRIIDPDGNPRDDLTLEVEVVGKARLGYGAIGHRPGKIRTDAEGRFRIEGLAPGLAYRAYPQAPQGQEAKERIDLGATTPGETRDLGDVTITFQDRED